MVKHMVAAAFLVFVCVASLVSVGSVRAQSVSTIFINADGSVSGTNAIQREGNRYDLTESLYNSSIVVLCNNIVLDGDGFTLQGPNGWPTPAGINLTCTGVTVENFVVKCWEVGILGAYDGNTIYDNSLINNERGIAIYADNYQVEGNYIAQADYAVRVTGNNDTFTRNTFDAGGFAFWITDSSGILITENNITSNNPVVFQTDYGGFQVYHNNFYNLGKNTDVLTTNTNATDADFLPWDNGYPSGGNYWSDYTTLYPNATEIGDSGIGDIPYNVTTNPLTPNLTVLDRYPLLSPFNIPSAGSETPQPSQTPAPSNSPTATAVTSSSPQKSPQQNEAVTTVAAVLAAVAAIEIVVFVALRRNRARSKIN
jgi:hypothetical protein